MSDLSSRIRAAMKSAGFNQSQLAEAASTASAIVSQQSVQQLVSGRNGTSRHLPAIAAALGVSLEWLAAGRGGKAGRSRADALFIGWVGAGGIIERAADVPALAGYTSPYGNEAPNVVEISGDSLLPLRDGWLVFYGPEQQGVSNGSFGKLCVVQTKDGHTILATLREGSRRGLFQLETWKREPKSDVKVHWAARVIGINPT